MARNDQRIQQRWRHSMSKASCAGNPIPTPWTDAREPCITPRALAGHIADGGEALRRPKREAFVATIGVERPMPVREGTGNPTRNDSQAGPKVPSPASVKRVVATRAGAGQDSY